MDHDGYREKTEDEQSIAILYYAFTTLTTIGLGDYCPKSNAERMMIAIYMFGGVAIFSKISGDFLSMLSSINLLNQMYEDSQQLQKFFTTLQKFNWKLPISCTVQNNISHYFDYRWENYKHFCFIDAYENLVE